MLSVLSLCLIWRHSTKEYPLYQLPISVTYLASILSERAYGSKWKGKGNESEFNVPKSSLDQLYMI